MPHANAPLTELGRLRMARCVIDDGWPLRQAAQRFQVSVGTASRWAGRYRAEGAAGMTDRSSRPRTSPGRTPTRTERRIVKVRLARLVHLDRATGQPVRRYERDAAGDLVHVDIKKSGNIPDGGGHKVHGRAAGNHNKQRTAGPVRRGGQPRIGYSYLHNAVDDHSRLAYVEILPDETKETATAFRARAQTYFHANGITVKRVHTDNGSCYRSRLWRDALTAAGITHKRTRPYRPQTNGKVERFNRTLLDEWAYARPYQSESERREALPQWPHTYNHHHSHTALKGLPPAGRVPNLTGQYS
ncbi:IS481 family transposase [Saccharothrix variisporea]|uniref:IS481 family transposase n=1 Tax=Saccharothrix variisporea TaxID=543527 RepID=UPI000EB10BD1|nr:IS481 family transposase [Saccharothrix variisporea]